MAFATIKRTPREPCLAEPTFDHHCGYVESVLPKPFAGPYSEDDLLLFGRFEQLYPISIDTRRFWVPEDNTVLRALQYVSLKTGEVRLPWHTFCWNNRDGCCAFRFRSTSEAPIREARACATAVRPGLAIVQLPQGGVLCLSSC